jgi:hypothetical protein
MVYAHICGYTFEHAHDSRYVERVEWAQQQLTLIKQATAAEMEDRCITHITEARSATDHYAGARRRAVKFLTEEQAAKFLESRDRRFRKQATGKVGTVIKPLRLLVQAPSGSGKTLIAIKLTSVFIADGVSVPKHDHDYNMDSFDESEDDEVPAVSAAPMSLLLVGHSESLVHGVLLPDLLATLEDESDFFGAHTVDRTPSGDIEVRCANAPGRVVVVCSADVLMREHERWPKRFGDVVVDEGHVVFSYQPLVGLDGQHVATDPVQVVRALESTMRGDDGGTCLHRP